MIVSQDLLYFELHKSGCSHTRKILLDTDRLACKAHGKHNNYQELDTAILGNMSDKIKVGGIRNPWDWYVSMWAFGCMGKGRYRQNVEELPLEMKGWIETVVRNPTFLLASVRKEWQAVYADAQDPKLFRRWLKMVFDRGRMNDSREGFKQTPISRYAGLLTYRYLRLYTTDFIANRNKIYSHEEMLVYDEQHNFIDLMIRTEDIEAGIINLYEQLGMSAEETESILSRHRKKTNTSARKGYQEYYDDETRSLVATKDAYLIKKYGYSY